MMVFGWFWRRRYFRLGYFGLDLSDISLGLKLDSEIDVISEEVLMMVLTQWYYLSFNVYKNWKKGGKFIFHKKLIFFINYKLNL